MTNDNAVPGALGEFLRTRRAVLSPDALAVPDHRSRRVPGLRREELAQLAGMSTTYYTRLEQGAVLTASAQVLDALAAALRLTAAERTYLHDLARPGPVRALDDTAVAPGLQRLVARMSQIPAVVLGRRNDVVMWNPLGHILLAPDTAFTSTAAPARPNLTRMLFLHERTRAMYVNWDQEARLAVASLRLVAAQFADDTALTGFVGEMCVRSDDFARIWAEHTVRRCTEGFKELDHPIAGRFDVSFQVLHAADSNGQRLLTHAPIDAIGEQALQLLALAADTTDDEYHF